MSPAGGDFGLRPWRRRASATIHCNWPLTERNSCAAQASTISMVAGSSRNRKLLVASFLAISYGLIIQSAGIDYGLSGLVGTEDHKQVAHHRSLAFLVKFYNTFLLELVQGHLNH